MMTILLNLPYNFVLAVKVLITVVGPSSPLLLAPTITPLTTGKEHKSTGNEPKVELLLFVRLPLKTVKYWSTQAEPEASTRAILTNTPDSPSGSIVKIVNSYRLSLKLEEPFTYREHPECILGSGHSE